jgi:hypothetical protein
MNRAPYIHCATLELPGEWYFCAIFAPKDAPRGAKVIRVLQSSGRACQLAGDGFRKSKLEAEYAVAMLADELCCQIVRKSWYAGLIADIHKERHVEDDDVALQSKKRAVRP